jgi:hypothetical protein
MIKATCTAPSGRADKFLRHLFFGREQIQQGWAAKAPFQCKVEASPLLMSAATHKTINQVLL